jgi:DNA-binding NarL/FixJ family response regulator
VLRDRARAWGIAALTPRERTILRLLANGRTNREIATELGLGAGTVKNRIGLLLPKLGATDRTQAVAIALQRGLLDDPAAQEPPRPLPYFNLGDFE